MRDTTQKNAFLKSLQTVVMSEGVSPAREYRSNGQVSLLLTWFPEQAQGLLAYDSKDDRWDQLDGDGNTHLMVLVNENGRVSLSPGDDVDVGAYLETTIEAGDELDELLNFYSTALASRIGSSAIAARTIAQFVEDVLLLVPAPQGKLTAVTLVGHQVAVKCPDIAAAIDAWFLQDWEALEEIGFFHDSAEWLFQLSQHDAIGAARTLTFGDMVLTAEGRVHYVGMLESGSDSNVGFFPAIVLRPKKTYSTMWLWDYLTHAKEAEGLVQRICSEWKRLPNVLSQIPVSVPSEKRDQVASSLAARTARMEYLQYLESAMRVREPIGKVVATYKKRTIAAKGLHTELLDELHAMQCPLPFFLEYPYRRYRRADDPLDRIRAAQQLLNVLVKSPLFLVVEELVSVGDPTGQEIIESLSSRPASDGALLNMQRQVVRSSAVNTLKLFRPLLGVMQDHDTWGKMVETRNRYSHPPFDPAPFIDAMDKNAAIIMESLRGALSNCRFLMPIYFQFVSGQQILVAGDICNSDSCFRRVNVPVKLPIESFPCGKLVVWREDPEASVTLGHLVSTKVVTENTLDFGLFDRMENDQARFTFLRSE
jgi:hypothetical protein